MIEPGPDGGPDLLVVYGTLRSGTGWRERLGVDGLVRSRGRCLLAGVLYDLGWYPGLVMGAEVGGDDRQGGDPVVGEVLELLGGEALATFDRFEGYDPRHPAESEYRRVAVRVAIEPAGTQSGGSHAAWVYLFNRSVRPDQRVAGGDWLEHLATRSSRHS